jgi:CBS domain-containing protein
MTLRQISDVVGGRSPVTLPATATAEDACHEMRAHGTGAVLIIAEQDQLVGIFTDSDAITRVLAEGRNPAQTPLADVMTAQPVTLPLNVTVIDALRKMQEYGFRHLPIVAEGRLVGVVSRRDIMGLEQARVEPEAATPPRTG